MAQVPVWLLRSKLERALEYVVVQVYGRKNEKMPLAAAAAAANSLLKAGGRGEGVAGVHDLYFRGWRIPAGGGGAKRMRNSVTFGFPFENICLMFRLHKVFTRLYCRFSRLLSAECA